MLLKNLFILIKHWSTLNFSFCDSDLIQQIVFISLVLANRLLAIDQVIYFSVDLRLSRYDLIRYFLELGMAQDVISEFIQFLFEKRGFQFVTVI